VKFDEAAAAGVIESEPYDRANEQTEPAEQMNYSGEIGDGAAKIIELWIAVHKELGAWS
jgi:hypothetical protein